MTEQETIDRYSTPGLKKHELTRFAKRQQLIETYSKIYSREEIEEMLVKLYDSEIDEQ